MLNQIENLVERLLESQDYRDIELIQKQINVLLADISDENINRNLEIWNNSVNFRAQNLNLEIPGNYEDIKKFVDYLKIKLS